MTSGLTLDPETMGKNKRKERSPVRVLAFTQKYRFQMLRRAATKSPIKMLTPTHKVDPESKRSVVEQKRLDDLRWRMVYDEDIEMLEDAI